MFDIITIHDFIVVIIISESIFLNNTHSVFRNMNLKHLIRPFVNPFLDVFVSHNGITQFIISNELLLTISIQDITGFII